MPTEKPTYGQAWMTAAMWQMLEAIEAKPRQMSELPRRKKGRPRMTATHMVDAGYLIGDMDHPDPWLLLTKAGRAEMARVRGLPRLPQYAGGAEPYYKRTPKAATGAETTMPPITPPPTLLLPAPEVRPPVDGECIAAVTVTLSVPVTVMVSGHIDAQSLASLVQAQVTARGVYGFLTGWRITSVLHGETILAAEGQG